MNKRKIKLGFKVDSPVFHFSPPPGHGGGLAAYPKGLGVEKLLMS